MLTPTLMRPILLVEKLVSHEKSNAVKLGSHIFSNNTIELYLIQNTSFNFENDVLVVSMVT